MWVSVVFGLPWGFCGSVLGGFLFTVLVLCVGSHTGLCGLCLWLGGFAGGFGWVWVWLVVRFGRHNAVSCAVWFGCGRVLMWLRILV